MMPKKERDNLEYFFHILNAEHFPWVAKGIKPISTYYVLGDVEFFIKDSSRDLVSKQEELFWTLHPINARFRAGRTAWEKYSWMFPTRKIKIISGLPSVAPSYETIMIINVEAIRRVIQEEYQLFIEVFGPSFNVNSFIKRLINAPEDYEKIVQGNHCLMGILYGYGKDNAKAFQQREEPYSFLLPPYNKHYLRKEEDKQPIAFERFLKGHIPYNRYYPLFRPPGFMVIPNSKETKALEERYLHFFKVISQEKENQSELKWSLLQFVN